MTGILAQQISLTAYGNQCLRTNQLPAGFYPENSVFQYCNTVDFREVDGDNDLLVAIDPAFWFRYLQQEGCQALRLYYQPAKVNPLAKEHQLAGFVGGGGTWLMEAIFEAHSDFWASRWQVTRKEDPDRRIWCVNYGRTSVNIATVNMQFDLAATAAELYEALEDIIAFTLQQNLRNWTDFFQTAAARLNNDTPAAGYYNEALIPDGEYGLHARQVLFTAGSAWAFGGMGSWNDQSFEKAEDNERFDNISARLYDAINRAVVASVNSPAVWLFFWALWHGCLYL
jgi:hypothetical protein